MGGITDLRFGNGREKRVKIFVDGKLTLTVPAETVLRAGLEVGQELSDKRVEELLHSANLLRCLKAASRYLSYRPRSESELRTQLHRHGFNDAAIYTVLTKLKEQGLVDDVAFARFWKDNRESFSPRSQWLTKAELRRKGVASEVIDQVVDTTNDYENAYRAALSRTRHLPLPEYQAFRQKLGDFLRRRGFNYEVINHTVKRIWEEELEGVTQDSATSDAPAIPSLPTKKGGRNGRN